MGAKTKTSFKNVDCFQLKSFFDNPKVVFVLSFDKKRSILHVCLKYSFPYQNMFHILFLGYKQLTYQTGPNTPTHAVTLYGQCSAVFINIQHRQLGPGGGARQQAGGKDGYDYGQYIGYVTH